MIKPGSKIKLGKYPGFNAATPSKQVLDISAIVALYEEILSENLLSGDKYESDIESSSSPNIQPLSLAILMMCQAPIPIKQLKEIGRMHF